MSRPARIAITALALACLQAAAFVVYRHVEQERKLPASGQPFNYQVATGQSPGEHARVERADRTRVEFGSYLRSPVLVHFWATWCAPCATELPTLLALARSRPRKFEILLVSVDQNWETVRHFFKGRVPDIVVLDYQGALRKAFAVTTLPRTHLIRRGGTLAATFQGARDWSTSEAAIALARLAHER